MSQHPLAGKVSLITGASRGIGAATALHLAQLGSDVVVNYRSKAPRAEETVAAIRRTGRKAIAIQADLTNAAEVGAMMAAVDETFGRLDILVLNASGGLEKGKLEDYPMALNLEAQLRTAQLGANLMRTGGRIVFVTSHWAHFYGKRPTTPGYEVVARSKHAGEQALRGYAAGLIGSNISLVVVSGDAIEGTITLRLLERQNPGLLADRSASLPTIAEFADAVAQAACDSSMPSGHTIFVGSTE